MNNQTTLIFRRLMASLLTVLSLFACSGCTKKNVYVEPPPPEVSVENPKEENVTNYIEVTGTAQPIASVDIRARVRGFLQERHFKEGSIVKKGELLLVIDEEPFRVKLDQAKAQLLQAQIVLKKAQQSQSREVSKAQLSLDQSQFTLAQDQERRIRQLIATRAVSDEELERAVAERKKTESQVESTQATLKQVEADYEMNISAADAAVAAAKNSLRDAEIELSYCRISSPIDGKIGRVFFDVGNLVGDGQASLLTMIMQVDPIYAYTNLSLDDFLKYRQAAQQTPLVDGNREPVKIELGFSNEAGYAFPGHVDFHDPQVDQGTGTVQLRGVFENHDGAILPGMFVRMRIPYSQQNKALIVSERSLGIDQLGQYVLVVNKEDKVEYRPVKVGSVLNGMRVVSGNLSTNDRVVVEGLLRARPGMKVTPKTEMTSVAPPNTSVKTAVREK